MPLMSTLIQTLKKKIKIKNDDMPPPRYLKSVPIEAPVLKENLMSTETAGQKIQSVIEKFGEVFEKIANAGENIALEEEAIVVPLLPPSAATAYVQVVSLIGKNLAALEPAVSATSSTTNAALRDAKVVALIGESILSTLAQAGVTVAAGGLTTLVSSIGAGLGVLNFTGITSTPVVPPTAPTA